jgi:hypothetical protein
LEPHSQTNDTSDPRSVFEGQLRECFGRVVYSHKTHEKCADILLSRLGWIKVSQFILSALTTGGFVVTCFDSGKTGAIVGFVVSSVLLVLNAYTKNYDLGELAQKHRQAGADLWIVREKYFSLLTDLRMGGEPIEKLQTNRDNLLDELHSIYSRAPSTTAQAYEKAQNALKFREDLTFSDKEIDAFLPKELKKG